jgi:hypothetical protein
MISETALKIEKLLNKEVLTDKELIFIYNIVYNKIGSKDFKTLFKNGV